MQVATAPPQAKLPVQGDARAVPAPVAAATAGHPVRRCLSKPCEAVCTEAFAEIATQCGGMAAIFVSAGAYPCWLRCTLKPSPVNQGDAGDAGDAGWPTAGFESALALPIRGATRPPIGHQMA